MHIDDVLGRDEADAVGEARRPCNGEDGGR